MSECKGSERKEEYLGEQKYKQPAKEEDFWTGNVQESDQCGVWRYLGDQWLRARLCCRKISDSIFWLYYSTPRWLAGAMPCPKKVQKKYTKRKDRNILSFIYLVNGLTNATSQGVAWFPKHQTAKSVLSVRRHYPKKRSFHRKPEYLSLYTGSKFATPKSF